MDLSKELFDDIDFNEWDLEVIKAALVEHKENTGKEVLLNILEVNDDMYKVEVTIEQIKILYKYTKSEYLSMKFFYESFLQDLKRVNQGRQPAHTEGIEVTEENAIQLKKDMERMKDFHDWWWEVNGGPDGLCGPDGLIV